MLLNFLFFVSSILPFLSPFLSLPLPKSGTCTLTLFVAVRAVHRPISSPERILDKPIDDTVQQVYSSSFHAKGDILRQV